MTDTVVGMYVNTLELDVLIEALAAVVLASYPGREGGGKAAWYQLHAHVLSIPTKAGPPNMTEYFPYYFSPVHISKLLRVIQTN